MIEDFIKSLNNQIKVNLKSGFLKEEYFTTFEYNIRSEVHSRMHALITKICFDFGFDIELEKRFGYKNNGKKISFKPDIALYKNNKFIGIIEYESTNSSDARFYDQECGPSDLRYFHEYNTDDEIKEIPDYWIIITTLPKNSVEKKDWKSYQLKRTSDEFKRLIQSPFNFYMPTYKEKIENIISHNQISSNIYLLNIDKNKVELIFPSLIDETLHI